MASAQMDEQQTHGVPDRFTDPFFALWKQFRPEAHLPQIEPYEIHELVTDPSVTLDRLWSFGGYDPVSQSRRQVILDRVREWLRPAEQSAVNDREQAEMLLIRCSLHQLALHGWRGLAESEREDSERERVLNQLLRTCGALSATIRNLRPRTDQELDFRIDWDEDGDGQGRWETADAAPPFSLEEAVADLAAVQGGLDPVRAKAVARQLLDDLRSGDLDLPLLERRSRSTPQTTWLRRVWPGNPADQGLLLPERAQNVEDEIALWQQAPQVASAYEEALLVCARNDEQPLPAEWLYPANGGQIAPLEAAPGAAAGFVTQLCESLQRATSMTPRTVCSFLATPMSVIARKTSDDKLRGQALAALARLRQLVK